MTTKITFYRRYFAESFAKNQCQYVKWLSDTLGPPGTKNAWFTRTYPVPTKQGINDLKYNYYFKNSQDATLFALKFG
jgi:hypothetical protein